VVWDDDWEGSLMKETPSLFYVPFYVWHDDIRPAPTDGNWAWVRTNEEAIRLLSEKHVDGISLDHDLGLHHYTEAEIEANEELLFGRGQAEETGLDLVRWMIENDKVPAKVAIHSWNPAGARRMADALTDAGYPLPLISPYVVRRAS
jgi:hypothetical protein